MKILRLSNLVLYRNFKVLAKIKKWTADFTDDTDLLRFISVKSSAKSAKSVVSFSLINSQSYYLTINTHELKNKNKIGFIINLSFWNCLG